MTCENNPAVGRTPPAKVRKELRTEVGFGCPVPGCGNPYLEWHHFNPTWRESKHHNAQGMIALCAEHHAKADAGAYNVEQLLRYKENKVNASSVKGSFDWRRHKLLARVGGNFYYETPRILIIDGHDVVRLGRDEEGYLLLSIEMLSLTSEERIRLIDNCWENIGNPVDLVSPPNGKQLSVAYENGDQLKVEFYVIQDSDAFTKKFQLPAYEGLEFPLTVVDVNATIGGTDIALTPTGTTINTNTFIGCFVANCGAGFNLDLGLRWRQNFCLVPKAESRNTLCACGSGIRYKHCHGLPR